MTALIDMVGFGLTTPVLPRLIGTVSSTGLAAASIWS
jgi:hypothetical protein